MGCIWIHIGDDKIFTVSYKMTERVYPKLPDSTHMEDKLENLKKN